MDGHCHLEYIKGKEKKERLSLTEMERAYVSAEERITFCI